MTTLHDYRDRILAFWQRITEPFDHVTEADQRQQSRLLASLALISAVATILLLPLYITFEQNDPSIALSNLLLVSVGVSIALIAYGLSRHGRIALASVTFMTLGSILIFAPSIFIGGDYGYGMLYYLAVLIVLGAVFLPLRITFLAFIGQMMVLVLIGLALGHSRILDTIGNPLRFNLFMSSITLVVAYAFRRFKSQQRKQLADSENRYRVLLDNIQDIVYEHTPDGIVLSVNTDAEGLNGWTADQLIGQPIQNFVHPDDIGELNWALSHPPREQWLKSKTLELRMRSQANEYRTFEFKTTPIYENGQLTRYSGIGRDITARIQTENALRESQRFAKQVTDVAPVMVMVFDLVESRISFINEYGSRFFGQSEQLITGAKAGAFVEALHPDDRQRTADSVSSWLRSPESDVCVVAHRLKNAAGEWRWFRSYHVVFDRDTNGQAVRLLIHSRDVTEQNEIDKKTLQLTLERERMTLVNRFMLALSHEFRTSLATIETSRYLASHYLAEDSSDKVEEKLEAIKMHVQRMADQLENLHTVYALQEPNMAVLNIRTVIEEIVAQHKPLLSNKGLTVEVLPSADPMFVIADEANVKIAIKHLLLNAINFSPDSGHIQIEMQSNGRQLAVQIKDSGPGIDEDDLPHIFDLFYRADPSRTLESGGVGVGLSIVKMIADAHGGSITVDSAPDQGSTFTLTLPLAST